MKRNLTEEERKLEQMGVDRNKRDLELLKKNLKYNKELLDSMNAQRDFDDKWRGFLREQKDDENKKVFDMIKNEIENKENLIKQGEAHLKDGVETHQGVG
jgi:hypothetical protein